MSKKTASKKTRPRRSAPASGAPVSGARASGAPVSGARASAVTPSTDDRDEANEFVDRILSDLWAGVESGNPLKAEIETSTCMGIPYVLGQRNPAEIESFIIKVLVDEAARRQSPDGAALLRVLMALGVRGVKKAASQALAQLTDTGVYPPEWVTEIGKVTPGKAWRRYDVLGDDEAIAAMFGYGESEHGVVVQVDLTGVPMATAVGVATNAATLIAAMTEQEDKFDRSEQISLAEARRRMEEPLARAERDPDPALSTETVAYMPLARTRIRRLPADGEPGPAFTAADRAAAVDEFMKSPLAADAIAADEEATRFWAEVLTGYSSRIPGEAPGQVGPRKLAHILLGHVTNSFVLSPAQRQHLEPAVTAWAHWSAAYRNLNEAETARLVEHLPDIFSRFDEAYSLPDSAAVRNYVSDLATSEADVSWLARNVGRRMFALPMPEQGGTPAGPRNVGDPADRRALTEAEFGGCNPPAGMTSEQFVDAAYDVIEELWRTDSDETFQTANRMFTEGISRHDIIHRLAGTPAPIIT